MYFVPGFNLLATLVVAIQLLDHCVAKPFQCNNDKKPHALCVRYNKITKEYSMKGAITPPPGTPPPIAYNCPNQSSLQEQACCEEDFKVTPLVGAQANHDGSFNEGPDFKINSDEFRKKCHVVNSAAPQH